MQNQETVIVGCVMLWQSHSTSGCREPFRSTPQFVTEFCPTNVCDGVINTSPRMKELSAARFAPVAIVSADTDAYYIFGRNGISDAVQLQLLEDTEAIFEAAAVAKHPLHESCPNVAGSPQAKTSEVYHD